MSKPIRKLASAHVLVIFVIPAALYAAGTTSQEAEHYVNTRVSVLTTRDRELREKSADLNRMAAGVQALVARASGQNRDSVAAAAGAEGKFQTAIKDFYEGAKDQGLMLERTDGEFKILQAKGLATATIEQVKPALKKMKINLDRMREEIDQDVAESNRMRDELQQTTGAEIPDVVGDYIAGKISERDVGLVEIAHFAPQGQVTVDSPQEGFFTILNLDNTRSRFAYVVLESSGPGNIEGRTGWVEVPAGKPVTVNFRLTVTQRNATLQYKAYFIEGNGQNPPPSLP